MKEKDYIKIMDRIRPEHIEEAVSWDASEQQSRRSIRRLSLGIGAIAASIAVVVGIIGYNAATEMRVGNSGTEGDDLVNEGLNLFGGHGKLTPFLANDGTPLYRDDEYYYMLNSKWHCYDRWAINGSTALERIGNTETSFAEGGGSSSFTIEPDILTDGEQIYTYHDNGLFITDSYGNETAFLAAPWKPCKIQKLSDNWYFLSALIEDSWLDGTPQPYVLMNTAEGDTINHFIDYGNAQADSEKVYYADFENKIYSAPLNDLTNASKAVEFGEGELQEWTVKDGCIYSVNLVRYSDVANDTAVLFCTDLQQIDGENSGTKPMMYVNRKSESAGYLKWHLLNDRCYQFTADFEGEHLTVLNRCKLDNSEEADLLCVDTESLWNSGAVDTMTDFTVFDTGDTVIFKLPAEGKNGEQLVQINTETYEYQYLGENYAPEQPKDDTQTKDSPAQETVPQEDSGFCSPETFSLYYIPQEHMDTDEIACYRMLPAVKASASQFNADVLGDSLPEGGGFRPMNSPVEGTDPLGIYEMKTTHYISYDEAREIIMNHDPTDTNSLFSAVDAAAGEYAGKYPYPALDSVCYEYWCKEDGSEFLVAMCSYAGEHETIEYVYFRYDAEAKQFAYEYIPARTRANTIADADAENNVLGGKGIIRPFITKKDHASFAEDDEYLYDLSRSMRARKNGEDTVFEPFTPIAIPQNNPEQKNLFAVDGMVLLCSDNTLYEVGQNGSLNALLTLTKDEKGNQLENLTLWNIEGFAKDTSGRPTRLFLRGYADRPADANGFGYNIKGILDLTTGKFSNLDGYGDYARYIVADDAVFVIGHMTEKPLDKLDEKLHIELFKYTADNNGIQTDVTDWNIENITAVVYQGSDTFLFRDTNGKLCKAKFGDKTAADTGKDAPFTVETTVNSIAGTNKIVYSLNNPARLILSDSDGSNPEVLKEGAADRDYGYDVFGVYSENGVIHVIYNGDHDRMTVLIKDGSSVTSYGID